MHSLYTFSIYLVILIIELLCFIRKIISEYCHGGLYCFLHPHGTSPYRKVFDLQNEQRRVHGSPFKACQYSTSDYFNCVERVRERKQRIFRDVLSISKQGRR